MSNELENDSMSASDFMSEECDDCGVQFEPDDTTFVGDWDNPEKYCSPFMQLTYLCTECHIKRLWLKQRLAE
jgi:hypothetical protein